MRTTIFSRSGVLRARAVALGALLCASLFLFQTNGARAATAAGTVIYNTSTAAYTDANSNSFNTTSNTVSVTVQNAPALTVTPPGNQNVTPAMTVVDTFTITNTGNAAGNVQLSTDATFGGTASATTLKGYVYGSNCTVAAPCTLATLNNSSNLNAGGNALAATSGSTTIGVEYQVSASAASAQTIQTTLSANITYAAVTGAQAETSANVTANPTDTLVVDARLDVKAAATTPGSGGANITWTITANNGGAQTAQGLASAKTVLGAANNGIAIFIPMPSYNSTALQLQAQPSAPTLSGASGGAAAAVYYNATACSSHPTTGWSTTYSATSLCLAVYVSNTTANVLPSAPSQSSGAGSVTTAQITFSFATNQPSGSGSANSNSVTLVASSAIGGLSWVTAAVPILGQGLAVGASQDAATASLLNNIQTNVTASSGTTPPGGASNQIGSNSFAAYSLLNGPFNNQGATGWYPGATGTPSADNNHDYEVFNVACTNNSSYGVNGASCTVGTNTILVSSLQNTGNSTDSIQLTATAPTGWKVQLYNATGCTAFIGTGCTQGASITSQSTDGGSISGTISVTSGTTVYYEAVYNATGNSATPFTAYTTQLAASGQSGGGSGTDANNTFNTLYPGGVVQVTNSVSVTSTNCPAGESPSNLGACPGGTIQYSVAYQDVVPAAVDSNKGTEPAFAYNACYTTAGSLVITNDGAAAPAGAANANNWSTYTNGIAAAASDTTSGSVITYYPSASTTYSAAQTKLTAQIGGASGQLKPGNSGTITFTAVVK